MGLLTGITAYICGPIEAVSDGAGWRDQITPDLEAMSIRVWNPLKKPNWVLPLTYSADGSTQKSWKGTIETDVDVYNANRQIRSVSRRLAAAADILICRMTGAFTAGTMEELSLAHGKPVFFWSNERIPSMWLCDQFATPKTIKNTFFDSWEGLHEYLKSVDNATVEIDPIKWIFLSWEMK